MTPLDSHRLHGLDNVRFFLCWLRRPARLGAFVPSGQALVAIEREASLCALLAARFPEVRVVHGDARALEPLLAQAGIGQAKVVVSSLPLLNISSADRRRVLTQAVAALGPDGVLVQYTYGPAAPVPSELRGQVGLQGERAGWVLANLPPAAVWRYRRAA